MEQVGKDSEFFLVSSHSIQEGDLGIDTENPQAQDRIPCTEPIFPMERIEERGRQRGGIAERRLDAHHLESAVFRVGHADEELAVVPQSESELVVALESTIVAGRQLHQGKRHILGYEYPRADYGP